MIHGNKHENGGSTEAPLFAGFYFQRNRYLSRLAIYEFETMSPAVVHRRTLHGSGVQPADALQDGH